MTFSYSMWRTASYSRFSVPENCEGFGAQWYHSLHWRLPSTFWCPFNHFLCISLKFLFFMCTFFKLFYMYECFACGKANCKEADKNLIYPYENTIFLKSNQCVSQCVKCSLIESDVKVIIIGLNAQRKDKLYKIKARRLMIGWKRLVQLIRISAHREVEV